MSIYMPSRQRKRPKSATSKITFVMQTTTGTLNANAIAKCSFDMPIRPALAPTIRITQEGAPDVRPYNVVFRYLSCPAKSRLRLSAR